MLTDEQINRIVSDFAEKARSWYVDGTFREYGRNGTGARRNTKWPEFWPGYNKAVRQRDELRVHIESGSFPAHLIHDRSPNQTQAEFDYVRNNFKQVTIPHYVDFENMIIGALHQSNWTFEFGPAAGEDTDLFSFKTYINTRIDQFDSLSDWMKHILPKIKTLDPMGVVCVMPKKVAAVEGTTDDGEVAMVIDPDVLIDPQPIYFPVEQVVGKEDGRWYLLVTNERSVVSKAGKDVREGMVLWLVDDMNCWRVEQYGKAHDLSFQVSLHFAHGCGYVPAEPLKGRPVIENGAVMYESYYLPAKDLFDLVLLDSMNLFMIKSNSVYPMRVMLGHECDYQDISAGQHCIGGTLHRQGDEGLMAMGKCPSCKGTGVAARLGPAGVLFVKEQSAREGGQQVKVQDAMTFVEPTATTPTILREEIRSNTAEGRRMLHLHSDISISGGSAETATQVGVGVKARANFIAPIASQIFATIDFVAKTIAIERYGTAEEYYTIIPATQYDLRTEADYLALLGEAMQKGLPPAAIEEVLRGYFNIRYASDPYMQEAMSVIVQADRLVAANWQQIAAMQGKGEVKAWEVALHQQALGLYDRLMQDPAFRTLDIFAKSDAMRQYAMQQFAAEVGAMNVPVLRPAQAMAQSIVEETENSREEERDEEMIEGVIEILRGIGDMDNRQRSAEERLADFAEQGVEVDREEFLRKVMETTITATMNVPEENVANTALNGAQVQSLVQIINQVGLGVITQQTAKPLIEAAFPGIAERTIDEMLAGVQRLTPEQAQQV